MVVEETSDNFMATFHLHIPLLTGFNTYSLTLRTEMYAPFKLLIVIKFGKWNKCGLKQNLS
jgi:hypothetical protein